jgi:hypothetical protein
MMTHLFLGLKLDLIGGHNVDNALSLEKRARISIEKPNALFLRAIAVFRAKIRVGDGSSRKNIRLRRFDGCPEKK